MRRAVHGGVMFSHVGTLASVLNPIELARPDETTPVIRTEGGWLRESFDRLCRGADTPFANGQLVERPDFVAEVVETTPAGRALTVAFHFRVPLEDASLRLATVDEEGVVDWTPPAVGEAEHLVMNLATMRSCKETGGP
jgi:hypothetical protein